MSRTKPKLNPRRYTDASPQPGTDAELAVLCDLLQERCITKVVVCYEGSGDSGAVEGVAYEPETVPLPDWVEERLKDLTESYCPTGYEINEGGCGSLTIYPAEGLAELEHSDRYEDSEHMDATTDGLPADLRDRLAERGVTKVVAHFDGCGDSGQFDDITVAPGGIDLGELWDELQDVLLERLPGGWELNSGSYGMFTVHVRSGRISANAYWRTESDSEPQYTRWKWRN